MYLAETSADRLLLTAPFSYEVTQYASNLSYEIKSLQTTWHEDAINAIFLIAIKNLLIVSNKY